MKFVDWKGHDENGEPVFDLVDINEDQLDMLVEATKDLNDLPETGE